MCLCLYVHTISRSNHFSQIIFEISQKKERAREREATAQWSAKLRCKNFAVLFLPLPELMAHISCMFNKQNCHIILFPICCCCCCFSLCLTHTFIHSFGSCLLRSFVCLSHTIWGSNWNAITQLIKKLVVYVFLLGDMFVLCVHIICIHERTTNKTYFVSFRFTCCCQ